MTEHGHCHTQATIAVARKLAERTWKTLTTGQMYELRDLEGQPVTKRAAKELIAVRGDMDPWEWASCRRPDGTSQENNRFVIGWFR
jgi:hypothetical protein